MGSAGQGQHLSLEQSALQAGGRVLATGTQWHGARPCVAGDTRDAAPSPLRGYKSWTHCSLTRTSASR